MTLHDTNFQPLLFQLEGPKGKGELILILRSYQDGWRQAQIPLKLMYLVDLQSCRNKWSHDLATEWKGPQDTLEESKHGFAFIPIICSNQLPPFLILSSL